MAQRQKPAHRQLLDGLREPERSIAYEEFYAVLSQFYGIGPDELPFDYPRNINDTPNTSDEAMTKSATLESKTGLPLEIGGTSTLFRIAEVAVWAAEGKITRFVQDN